MAQKVEIVFDSEAGKEVIELIDEQLWRPEIGALVGDMRRLPSAQLVVENNRNIICRENLCVRLHVHVRHAWAAVKSNERSNAR
jgi:hypothetical protein